MDISKPIAKDKSMSTDVARMTVIDDAERAFGKQVTSQVARVTQELMKLEQLLKAGMVDPTVLMEFRRVVDNVRKTSWAVQQKVVGDPLP
jgi:hypothetical protein